MAAPAPRLRAVNDAPLRPERDYVLYWMIGSRRTSFNFALDQALARSRELGKGLVVFEPLRLDYPYASARFHRFVIDGMADNARRLRDAGIAHYPYVEPSPGAAKGLLEALAERAACVVTDDTPTFFLPRMLAAAGAKLDVRLEAVDGNGLLPLREAPKVFERAQDLRRFLQRTLPSHLTQSPLADPLADHGTRRIALSPTVSARWPMTSAPLLAADARALEALPIDHGVAPVRERGGPMAGAERLRAFVGKRLASYAELRNHPDEDGGSGLSPYLHFGFVGVHQVLAAVAERERWSVAKLGEATGKRAGFWGLSESAESFMDELVTWRELGLNLCSQRADYADYGSLPAWARKTLDEHRADRRQHLYDLDTLERAATGDEVWNAAQRQLTRDGRLHNYLRMLWGKKVLEWSPSPEQALRTLFTLNDKYALDGRDPNSVTGITWVFGRYDRPWGPSRPIFGTVRYMSSQNTVRKLRMSDYLARYGARGSE